MRQSRRRPFPAAWLAERLIARPRWHPPVGNRACSVHPFLPAVDRCDRCGQPFCADCLQHVARWRIGIGSGAHGLPVPTVLAGTVAGRADPQGELRATIAIANRVRSAYGAFDLHLRATGDQGSLASRDIHGGEIVVPVTSPCPPAPQPCPPGFGRPARSPN
jgi:hypothetical protein